MAFLKEGINAFVKQPVEKKRSDHRLKSAESCEDTRAWVLDKNLNRQQFLNVVNSTASGRGGAEGEDSENGPYTPFPRPQLEDKVKELEEERDILKLVVADKENEIERLLFRISSMAEVGVDGKQSDLQTQLNALMKQYEEKIKELDSTKDKLDKAEQMANELHDIMESAEDDPTKSKIKIVKAMQAMPPGKQGRFDNIEDQMKTLEDKLKNAYDEIDSLKQDLEFSNAQVEALASGDSGELNKIISDLRNELTNTKALKDAENMALKNMLDSKDGELKRLKDILNSAEQDKGLPGEQDIPEKRNDFLKPAQVDYLPDFKGSEPSKAQDSDVIDLKNKINELEQILNDEKELNNKLKDDLIKERETLNKLASADDSELKKMLAEAEVENKLLKMERNDQNVGLRKAMDPNKPSSAQADYLPDFKGSEPSTAKDRDDIDLKNKINELEQMLNDEKELNNKLKDDLMKEKERFNKLASADDSELKKMLAEAEVENKLLKMERNDQNVGLRKAMDPNKPSSAQADYLPDFKGSEPSTAKDRDDIDLKNKINELEQMLNDEKELNNKLKDDLMKEKERFNKLASADDSELKKMLAEAEAENKLLKMGKNDQNVGLKKTMDPNSSSIKTLPFEVSDKIIELEEEIKKLLQENRDLKDTLGKLSGNKSNGKLGESDSIEKESPRKDQIAVDDTINELLDKNTLLMGENERLKSENDGLNKALNGKENELKQLKQNLHKSDTDNDISKINDLEHENDRLVKELKEQQDKNKALEDEIGSIKEDTDRCNESLTNRDKTIEDLENELKEQKTKSQVGSTADQHKAEQRDEENLNLKAKIKELNDRIQELIEQEKGDQSTQEIPKLLSEIEKLKADNDQLKNDNDILLKEQKAASLAQSEKELKDALDTDAQNEKLKQKVKLLEDELKNQKDTFDTDAQNEKLKQKVKLLEDELKNQKDAKAREKDQGGIRERSGELATESDSLKNQTNKHTGNTDDVQDKKDNGNDILENKINALQNENNDLKSINDRLKTVLKDAENAKHDLEQENANLSDLLSKAEEGGLDENEVLKMHKDKAEKLKKENEALKQKVAELELEVDELKDVSTKAKSNIGDKKPINSEAKLYKQENSSKDPIKTSMSEDGRQRKSPIQQGKQPQIQQEDVIPKIISDESKQPDVQQIKGKIEKEGKPTLKDQKRETPTKQPTSRPQTSKVKAGDKPKKEGPTESLPSKRIAEDIDQMIDTAGKGLSSSEPPKKSKTSDKEEIKKELPIPDKKEKVKDKTPQKFASRKETGEIKKRTASDNRGKEVSDEQLTKSPTKQKKSSEGNLEKERTPSKHVKQATKDDVDKIKLDREHPKEKEKKKQLPKEGKINDFDQDLELDEKHTNKKNNQNSMKKRSAKKRSRSLDSYLQPKEAQKKGFSAAEKEADPSLLDRMDKKIIPKMKSLFGDEIDRQALIDSDRSSKGYGDKEYDNELNTLKKKLNKAEKQIKMLEGENLHLKAVNEELKKYQATKDGKTPFAFEDSKRYSDEATSKLNRILQKGIRNGLKSLYLDELEFVHDALNDTMADRQGRPPTPARKTTEELQNIVALMEQRMMSLLRRLDNYRKHSNEQHKKLMDYSETVQRLKTAVGLLEMKVDSLQYETKQLRDLVSYEKEKSKKLETMLKSILDNCKCTRKWTLQQNYPGLQYPPEVKF